MDKRNISQGQLTTNTTNLHSIAGFKQPGGSTGPSFNGGRKSLLPHAFGLTSPVPPNSRFIVSGKRPEVLYRRYPVGDLVVPVQNRGMQSLLSINGKWAPSYNMDVNVNGAFISEANGLPRQFLKRWDSNNKSGFGSKLTRFTYGRPPRSEERRVGKECRSRWARYH